MKSLHQSITNHYHKDGIYEDILQRLKSSGVDLSNVSRKDIAGVDEFHVRGAAVSRELAKSIDIKGAKLLDVGCGLGGPCRMLAEEFNCSTTGIDLSQEYIRTAEKLSSLVGLDDKTNFVQGDANQLPFEDNSFDVVWTQHVQMNILDKKQFYSEIHRVLKKRGHFIYYDIFKKGKQEIMYPVPWANSSGLSFLFPYREMDKILYKLGFSNLGSKDQSDTGIAFFESLMIRLKELGPPKLGLHVLMGESAKPKILNLLEGLKTERLVLISGVYKKA
jgi:SAM-dependent methyltransferase